MTQTFERQDIGYLLTAYADGQLAPEGVMWVEEQLDRNADLRAKLKEIRQLQAGLRTAFAGGAPAFVLDLPRRDALLASAANPPRGKMLRFPSPMWIGLAASVMAIVYVGMQTISPLRRQSAASATRDEAQYMSPMRITTIDAPLSQPTGSVMNEYQKSQEEAGGVNGDRLARAKEALARNDLKTAEAEAWKTYESDRTRDDARQLYLEARRARHGQADSSNADARLEKLASLHEEKHKSLTPQNDPLVHPDEWQRKAMPRSELTTPAKPVAVAPPAVVGATTATADRFDKEHKLLSENIASEQMQDLEIIQYSPEWPESTSSAKPASSAPGGVVGGREPANAAPADGYVRLNNAMVYNGALTSRSSDAAGMPSAPPMAAPATAVPAQPQYGAKAQDHKALENTKTAEGVAPQRLAKAEQAAQKAQPSSSPARGLPALPKSREAGPQTGKDNAVEQVPIALAEVDDARPINQLEVPIEEKTTSEDENSADLAKGREEAVASSDTGSTGAFMAIGAGGGSSGMFGNRNGGGKRRALAKADRDAENIPVLKQVGGVAGQVGDGLPTQVEVTVTDPTVTAGTTVRITRNDLDVVDGKVVSLDDGRAVIEVNGQSWNKHGAKIKAGDVVSTIHPPWTVVPNQTQTGFPSDEVQSANFSPQGVVASARYSPQGDQDLLMLTVGADRERIKEGMEFFVIRGNEYIVRVRAEKMLGDMAACRIIADSWNNKGLQIQQGDLAINGLFGAPSRPLVPAAAVDPQQSLAALRAPTTFEGTFDLVQSLRLIGGEKIGYALTTGAQGFIGRQVKVSLRDEAAARGVLRAVRSAGLQAQFTGGVVHLDAATRPLDPADTQGFDLPTFKNLFGTSPMQATAVDAIQTVAIDADTASYQYAKARVASGQPVDPTTIKPEHFINAMPMDYPAAQGPEAFTLFAEAAPSPFARAGTSWGPRTALVSIGAVAKPAAADERKPLALTLAIDCSGSMAQAGGLDRIQRGLLAFVEHLRAEDRVSIVAFGDQARVILPATPGNDRAALINALENLATGGATNAAEGLGLAYQLAAETAAVGIESRVLLATDGGTVAGADDLLRRVTAFKDRGITLVVVGTGATYRAGPLQDLATKGDGQHFYVGSDEDAEALFTGKLLPDRLAVLAKDAKLQVTWNPQRVSHARLIGYDQRRLAAKDFRDNTVDAGELSQDTQVTALFEVLLVDGGAGPLGTAAVRYKDMRREQVRELACPLPGTILQSQPSERLRLLACAAATAEWLQRGWWSNVHLITPQEIAAQLARCPQPIANELRAMVK
jgi:Ca-activated chloride channel homolog